MELQEFDFSFLVEAISRATLADLLTYKDGPDLGERSGRKVGKGEAGYPSKCFYSSL